MEQSINAWPSASSSDFTSLPASVSTYTRRDQPPMDISPTSSYQNFPSETPNGGTQNKRSKPYSPGQNPKSPKRDGSATTPSLRLEDVDTMDLQKGFDLLVRNNFRVQRANELKDELLNIVKKCLLENRSAESEGEPGRGSPALSSIRSKEDIEGLKVKDLKAILAENGTSIRTVEEKSQLVSMVTSLWSQKKRSPSDGATREQTRTYGGRTVPPQDNMTIPKLKEELKRRGVDFSKALEKEDFVKLLKSAMDKDAKPGQILCRICNVLPVDCLFLNCGHLIACSSCGSGFRACPACHEYVVRTTRVYKS